MSSTRPHADPTPLGDLLKAGFRRHAAGVCVVVGRDADGPVGLTVSSVASVSADPPVLSFSCARSSGTAARLVRSDRLAVSVLGADHADVAAAVADPQRRGFGPDLGWHEGADGLPRLTGAPATMLGTPSQVLTAGASWLVLLAVDDVVLGEAGRPLVYHDRGYATTAPAVVPLSAVRDAR